MEVELMVTKHDDDRRQGEYRAICSGRLEGRVLQFGIKGCVFVNMTSLSQKYVHT